MGVPANAGRAFAFFKDSFLLRSTPQKSEPYRAAIPYVEDKRLAAGVQVLPYAVGKRISFGATSKFLFMIISQL